MAEKFRYIDSASAERFALLAERNLITIIARFGLAEGENMDDPQRHETTDEKLSVARQENFEKVKDNIEISTQMPKRAVDIVKNYPKFEQLDDQDLTPIDRELAQLIAEQETENLPEEINHRKAKILKIFTEVALESAQTYSRPDDKQATEDASRAGINSAEELVRVIMSEEVNVKDVLNKISLEDVIEMIALSLPDLDINLIDRDALKESIKENFPSWYDDEARRKHKEQMEEFCSRDRIASPEERVAARYVVSLIHASWAGIQGRKTAWDADQVAMDIDFSKDSEELFEEYQELEERAKPRIFRAVFRRMNDVIKESFANGSDFTDAVAKAAAEVIKDIVNFK